jgi:hypothetical protein
VKAKGISEKAMIEKTASERPASAEKPQEKSADPKSADPKSADAKAAESKPADAKPAEPAAETASIPAEPRRHTPAPREKVRVVLPSPVQPSPVQPAAVQPAAPVVAAAPNPAPAVEAAVAPEERRDAADLARAAIERLRGTSDSSSRQSQQDAARAPETSRAPETARPQEAPRVATAPPLRPLPIMVSTPPSESFNPGSQPKPPYAANAATDDPHRPTPPADIPLSRPPLDLHAEAAEPTTKERTTVADDMLSAAKSVFHAVLPK